MSEKEVSESKKKAAAAAAGGGDRLASAETEVSESKAEVYT